MDCKQRREISRHTPFSCIVAHRDRDKMVAIFQTTFWNGFSWMKIYEFRLKFHWRLFLMVPNGSIDKAQHYLDNGLALTRRQSIIWTNGG